METGHPSALLSQWFQLEKQSVSISRWKPAILICGSYANLTLDKQSVSIARWKRPLDNVRMILSKET